MESFEIVGMVDRVIAQLSVPVRVAERADGWTPEGKQAMTLFFKRLQSALADNRPIEHLNISRAFDSWGVTRGEILERAAQVSKALRTARASTGGVTPL
ncbi:MAG: hypothetical protein V4508_14800 [Pseudomonadota bacterium]